LWGLSVALVAPSRRLGRRSLGATGRGDGSAGALVARPRDGWRVAGWVLSGSGGGWGSGGGVAGGVVPGEGVGAIAGAGRPDAQAAEVDGGLGDDQHEPGFDDADDVGPASSDALGLELFRLP